MNIPTLVVDNDIDKAKNDLSYYSKEVLNTQDIFIVFKGTLDDKRTIDQLTNKASKFLTEHYGNSVNVRCADYDNGTYEFENEFVSKLRCQVTFQ